MYVTELLYSVLWISSSVIRVLHLSAIIAKYFTCRGIVKTTSIQAKQMLKSHIFVRIATKLAPLLFDLLWKKYFMTWNIFVTQSANNALYTFSFWSRVLNTYGLKRVSSRFPSPDWPKNLPRTSDLYSVDDKMIFIYWCQRKNTSWEESADDSWPGAECIYQRLAMKLVVGAS